MESNLRWNYPFRVYLTYSVNIVILDSLENLFFHYVYHWFQITPHLTDQINIAMVRTAILDSIFFKIFARRQKYLKN